MPSGKNGRIRRRVARQAGKRLPRTAVAAASVRRFVISARDQGGRAVSPKKMARGPFRGWLADADGRTAGTSRQGVVVMSEIDYAAMLDRPEEAEARAAYAHTRDEQSFPADVARRLVGGENPVRVFRQYRGIALPALAEMIGASKSYLSEIESGKKPGSTRVMAAIADKLDVSLDDLV